MSPFPPRTIITAYKNLEEIKAKYPRRNVHAAAACPNDEFIVLRVYPKGTFVVKMKDWSVWIPYKFPYFRKWKNK